MNHHHQVRTDRVDKVAFDNLIAALKTSDNTDRALTVLSG
jgi:hypothetical protein